MVEHVKNIAFIGLGAMGEGIAVNLAKAGYLQTVWNRTASKSQRLSDELSINIADSVQSLAAKSDVIFMCVSSDEDVLELIEAIAAEIKPNSVVIDSSTISRKTAQQAAAILAAKQAYFLDAPVSGGVEGARKGTLAMMVGGDEAVVDTLRPILASVATKVMYMGASGAGQATKAVNQIMAAGINQAVTQALAFANAENLPLEKVIEVVSGGAAGNWFLSHRGLSMISGEYQTGFKVALHHKDLAICQAMAVEKQLDLSVIEQTRIEYEQLIKQGFGAEDISALYRIKIK